MKHIKLFLTLLTFCSCSKKTDLPEPVGYVDRTYLPSSAKAILLLDFNGGKVASNLWKVDSVSASGLNASQQQVVFDTVLKDFSEFAIAVTTNEGLFRSSSIQYKMRVLVTESYQWAGNNLGGYAFDSSIVSAEPPPCFVFPPKLGYEPRWVAKTISHEVGHTFGLSHQTSPHAIMSSGVPSPIKTFLQGYNVRGEWQDDVGMIKSVLNK